jgi:L-threonylcarbamoyladenylate synthase
VKTIITTEVEVAAEVIRRGGIVAFPTETVYGLGANIFDEQAVEKIFRAKMRPADNPLIAHVAAFSQIEELAAQIPGIAELFIQEFFPGPLTIVLKKSKEVPNIATAGLDTIGVRMPKAELAYAFLRECSVPVVAPSANLSGRPSPTTFEAVIEDLDGRIDCVLKGEPTEIGLESTVVDCTGPVPLVLRAGAISLTMLRSVAPETRLNGDDAGEAARSPGMRHKHYCPKARVVILDRQDIPVRGSAFIGVSPPKDSYTHKRICKSVDEYARSLFEFFRECDRIGIETIVCEPVKSDGIGAALMDRLRRAAEN